MVQAKVVYTQIINSERIYQKMLVTHLRFRKLVTDKNVYFNLKQTPFKYEWGSFLWGWIRLSLLAETLHF